VLRHRGTAELDSKRREKKEGRENESAIRDKAFTFLQGRKGEERRSGLYPPR